MKKIMLAVLATAFVTAQAYAFSGTVEFVGKATASGASGAGTTTISFTNPWHVTTDPLAAPDGVYTGSAGTAATLHNFSFTGDGAAATLVAGSPIQPEWSFSFGGNVYTFDLLALTNGHVQSGSMSFSGTGVAFINGGSATSASWSLQGSSAKGFTFRLSSSTTAAPDGGSTVALLGIALAGIEGARRMIRARKA